MLRPFWTKWVGYNGLFGLALISLFGIPRFIIVLQANQTGNYTYVSVIFVCMWIAPFVFLTRDGRRSIGMRKPKRYPWLVLSPLLGIAACAIMFVVSRFLFGLGEENWLVYISRPYQSLAQLKAADKQIYFLIYAIAAMTFSPVGEELLYRGIIHGSFAARLGEQKASWVDSLAFAVTHLAHFGIVFVSGAWTLFLFPGLLWVLFMVAASFLFFACKEKTGSILGAILCHAGFNLAMTYFLFYAILSP